MNKPTLNALILIFSMTLCPTTMPLAVGDNATSSSESVFIFQQKMAEKGHPEAQYKLAMMYESGTGIDTDMQQARNWYNKAALQDHKPARNRLVYLDIKQNGFKESHNIWLKNIKQDAVNGDGEALFVLGQMYAHGTGIEQNINEALRVLKKAVTSNITGAEYELAQATKVSAEAEEKKAAKARHDQAQIIASQQQQKQKIQLQFLLQKRQSIEQKLIEKQQQIFAEKYNRLEQSQTTSAIHSKHDDKKEPREESTEQNICSGNNRFIATCR